MKTPPGWSISAKGNYICMCYQFKTEVLSEVASHMSEFPGFCARGLKCIAEDKFECICGDKFLEKRDEVSTRNQAYNHICNQLDGLQKKCINQFRNKCQKCNLQLDSPSAFKLHIKTKSHLNFENKVDLYCKICNVKCDCQTEMLKHLQTKKHLKISLQQTV